MAALLSEDVEQGPPIAQVRLSLANHSAGGLTEADFETAKVFDGLD